MTHYLLKITRTPQSGGEVSYLTDGYGWHPDITPKKFYSLHEATTMRNILKVDDQYKSIYTGKVEIEEVKECDNRVDKAYQFLTIVAFVMSTLAIIVAFASLP